MALITEEPGGPGASPGVEQQPGPALLEGLYSPGDHRGTARPQHMKQAYISPEK